MSKLQLKLSHDEIVMLAAIADQELVLREVTEELTRLAVFRPVKTLQDTLQAMIEKGLLVSKMGLSPYPLYYPCPFYAIAPEILALNSPPYSYESWRTLSE